MRKFIAVFSIVMLLLAVGFGIWFAKKNAPGDLEHSLGGTTNATTLPVTKPSSTATMPSSGVTEPNSEPTMPSGSDSTQPEHTHEYAIVVTAPTCTEDGYATYTCECGDSYVADEVSATGHSYSTVTIPPTTQGQGYDVHTCTLCGDSYEDNFVDALPEPDPEHTHSYNAAVTEPTCTTAGYTVYTCGCGDSYTADEVAATGHTYEEMVTEPTCTADGYTTYACNACGHSYVSNHTAAKGHEYTETITAPTCTATGYTTYVCKSCGHSYTGNNTAAQGHDYETVTVPPTTEADGYDLHTCSRCGDSYKDNYTDAQPEYTLSLGVSKLTVTEGDTYTFKYTYDGPYSLTWSSSNTSVATISSSGKMTAKGAGTAVITLTDGKKTAQCKVTVEADTATLTVYVTSKTLFVGDTYQIEYTYTGDKSKLTFTCEFGDVLTVDSNGKVTTFAANTEYICVSDGTTTVVVEIMVKAKPDTWATDIEFMAQDGPLYSGVTKYVGDYLWFVSTTSPNEAMNGVTVTSSNKNVVSVTTQEGWCGSNAFTQITLNFKNAGTSTITLTSADGKVTKSYVIIVKSGYDFDPGDGRLTPEQFADYAEQVMVANGFESYDPYGQLGSWRLMTLRPDELNFDRAVQCGQNLVHSWWPNGNKYCQIVYIGQNEDGNYQFHICWG